MNIIKDILKGICIGIANIIPGFSGGTMAVILHTYDRLVFGLADFIHHPLKVIKDLIWLGIGIVVGVLAAIVTIAVLLEHFPLPTVLFFVGLILGSIPAIFKEASTSSKNKLSMLWMIPAAALIIVLPLINGGEKSANVSFVGLIIAFLMGTIGASTMIIPGVSGSLTLMAFGYYAVVLTSSKDILSNLTSLGDVKNEIIYMAVFAIGCIVGIVFIAKLMKLLISKFRGAVYYAILGLLIASPFSIIYTIVKSDEYSINYHSPGMWVCAIILLIIGTILPILMEYASNKYFPKNAIEQEPNELNES